MGADTAHTRHLVGSIPTSLLLSFFWSSADFSLFNSTQHFSFGWDYIYSILTILLPFYFILNFLLFFYLILRGGSVSFTRSHASGTALGSSMRSVPVDFIMLLSAAQLIILLPITGPECFLWFSHFFMDSFTVTSLLIFLVFSFLVFWISAASTSIIDRNSWLILASWLTLPFLFFSLYASTNLYTMIVCFEIITSLTFLLLSVTQYKNTTSFSEFVASINSLLLFFWVGTLSSVSLFTFLLIHLAPHFYNSTWFFGFLHATQVVSFSETLLALFFILIIFMKLGLPPFITWKFSFYQGLSFDFIYYYNVIYLLFLFNYILLLFFYQSSVFLCITSSWLFIVLQFSALLTLILFFTKFTNVGGFLVVSTAATSFLLIWALTISSLSYIFMFIQ